MPCYNEGEHFRMQEYHEFISSHPDVLLCMVNDGSSDNTLEVLHELKASFSDQVQILDLEKNGGKAEAIRSGILYCLDQFQMDFMSYLDADLAISFEECYNMTLQIRNEIVFCCASRILKLGSKIKRKRIRFLAGRTIATFISGILDIKVYDTQCGCKVFHKDLAEDMFREKFISTWMFDVEIFYRILIKYGRLKAVTKMLEVPLIDFLSFFYSIVVFVILRVYRIYIGLFFDLAFTKNHITIFQ